MFRNRLRAVRSLFERQRVANESVGTLDVIAVAVEGTDANAQVFQVRDGVLADRQSFYLENRAGRSEAEVAEEFAIQYYSTSLSIPAEIVGPPSLAEREVVVRSCSSERREGPVELRHAQRGEKRRIYELAERNARLALEQDKLRAERRRQQRVDALNDLREALELDALPVRIECFDISNLGADAHGRLDGRVRGRRAEEVGLPPLQDPRARRAPGRLRRDGRGAVAAAWRSSSSSASARRTTRRTTPASRRCPGLIVIDGGKGQLSSGARGAGASSSRQGVTVVSLAKRLEEIFVPGRKRPIVLPRDSPALQLLQRIRDEAHRFAIEHHRLRRDRSMKALDPRRAAGHRPGPQAHAAAPLRLAGALPRRDARGARGGAGPAGQGGPADSRAAEQRVR